MNRMMNVAQTLGGWGFKIKLCIFYFIPYSPHNKGRIGGKFRKPLTINKIYTEGVKV